MKLTRKEFLKSAAIGAAGAAALGVTGGVSAAASAAPAEGESRYPAWLGEPPVIAEADIVGTVTADIVIVGGGDAGSMCAFAAAEAGAKVVVVESQSQSDIFYYGLHDIASINSKFALDSGVPEIKKSEFIAEFQRRSHNRTDPRLVKKFTDNSGEMIDWLMENIPEDVREAASIHNLNSNNAYFEMGGEINGFKCWSGTVQISYNNAAPKLIADAEARGAKWYWEHTGVVLLTEADGEGIRVAGLIAKDAEGNYVKFEASKAVVLACGGYGANPEMYLALQDEQRWLYESHGLDSSELRCAMFGRDGSGIKMGLWAGGSMDPGPRTLVSPQVVFMSENFPANVLRWGAGFQGGQNPWGNPFVWVDESGRRFMDETFMGIFGQMQRVERRKPGKYFCFFDSKWAELMERSAPEHFSMPVGQEGGIDLAATFASWIERGPLGAEAEEGGQVCAWGANSLDELLGYMGFGADMQASVKAEIEKYNAFCANGEDEDFGRDPKMLLPIDEPPFYGMFSVEEKPMIGTVTLNGLVIDEYQRVLDTSYDPIEGLYATGNNSGGRFAVEYSTPLQGLTLGMAMTLGRVLGKELAER